MHQETKENWQDYEGSPGRLSWPIRRLGWFLEKYFLWPVADSFRAIGRQLARIPCAFRYRSPIAYIAATLMVTLTAGAIAAAVYFYNQQKDSGDEPVVATTAIPTETVIPSTPTPTTAPTTVEDTTPNSGNADDTLQGVVPNFTTAGKTKQNAAKSGGSATSGSAQKLPGTVVRPAPVPKSPPLKVAHGFATTFVSYEIGGKGAAKQFTATATPELAKELRQNPPKLPSTGQIPKATVVNVVAGKKTGDAMEVSVSLMRTGAASELRLSLIHKKDKGWLVSEVRG
ncbi:MAG: hypothetical protein KDB66_03695 [Solirubrobacterales bacterium]|nr:hypothetical protein [Solirubrobacterales bacterium]